MAASPFLEGVLVPIYEYSCNGCGHEFEVLVRKNTILLCPRCANKDLDRLPSLSSVHSPITKQLGLRAAKRRDASQADERVRAQREYELNHD
ncbi:MAG: FmdB family transcriptional regulator [Acidobacteria bacterium]|nr:FmdB family transcriptional regulator [Acidobacteriota bacterium]HCH36878.1 FmdB family transcriptional regulator [Acidobacteriota bacterium]